MKYLFVQQRVNSFLLAELTTEIMKAQMTLKQVISQ